MKNLTDSGKNTYDIKEWVTELVNVMADYYSKINFVVTLSHLEIWGKNGLRANENMFLEKVRKTAARSGAVQPKQWTPC